MPLQHWQIINFIKSRKHNFAHFYGCVQFCFIWCWECLVHWHVEGENREVDLWIQIDNVTNTAYLHWDPINQINILSNALHYCNICLCIRHATLYCIFRPISNIVQYQFHVFFMPYMPPPMQPQPTSDLKSSTPPRVLLYPVHVWGSINRVCVIYMYVSKIHKLTIFNILLPFRRYWYLI